MPKDSVLNARLGIGWIRKISVKFFQKIASSPTTKVFAHNVLMDITLMKIRNANYYLKIVWLLTSKEDVHNARLASKFQKVNAKSQDQLVSRTQIVLLKMTRVNAQNADHFMN